MNASLSQIRRAGLSGRSKRTVVAILAGIFGVAQLASLRHLFDGRTTVDEGVWWAIANQLNATGGLVYAGAVDHKPPAVVWGMQGLLGSAPLADSINVVHLSSAILFAASLVGIYALSKELLGSCTWALLATAAYSLDPMLLDLRILPNQRLLAADLWGLSFIPLVLALRKSGSRREWMVAASGLIGGSSVLIQQMGVLVAPVALALMTYRQGSARGPAARSASVYLAAFIVPLLGLAIWGLSNGLLPALYEHLVAVNRTDWSANAPTKLLVASQFVVSRVLLWASVGLLGTWLFRANPVAIGRSLLGPLVTWCATVIAVNWASIPYYGHYNVPLVLPLILVSLLLGHRVGLRFVSRVGAVNATLPAIIGRSALFAVVVLSFGIGIVLVGPEVEGLGAGNPRGNVVRQEMAIAAFIDEHTAPGEAIYIFSNPILYARADRTSPTKFLYWTWVYETSSLGREYVGSIVDMLVSRKARMVLISSSYEKGLPSAIRAAVDANYASIATLPYDSFGQVAILIPR